MKKGNTIYALVRLDNEKTRFSCHVYSKQTSNFEKMKEYREEIKQKYPNSWKIFITTRENAEAYKWEYYKWWKENKEF